MKAFTLLFFLLLCHAAFSQQTVYQQFEVDSVAMPKGGMAYLNTFIQANLRKPILAEAKGLGGRIIVSAVVEPDGHVTDTKIIKSLRPDCDREALRVFSLFNAWQPAQKEGKSVRQLINIPVLISANTPYTYADGGRINYFDEAMAVVPDGSERARYKQVLPIDTTTGLPNGDMVIFERTSIGWKESTRWPLVRRPDLQRNRVDPPAQLMGYENADGLWNGTVFSVVRAGGLVRRSYYDKGRKSGTELVYHANGVLAMRLEDQDAQSTQTTWYRNGQIREIRTIDRKEILGSSLPEKVLTFWDSTGRQRVKEGAGQVDYAQLTTSRMDTNHTTRYVEQGAFEGGLKQGKWLGRYDDGSYAYEEYYEKGICTGGKAVQAGGDTLRYTVVEKNAEFKGGLPALGDFLSRNLNYPEQAIKARVEGKVYASFVIGTTGAIDEIIISKGIGFGCDLEAKRVISKMQGKWTPGMQRGQPIPVRYNLPINFAFR